MLSPSVVTPLVTYTASITLSILQSSNNFFVDNNLSNLDNLSDKGSHSNFTAQQYGPDSIYDNLLEETERENWLGDWQKRIRVEVDQTDIIDLLSDFQALVYLSNSSGLNNDDVSCVFDELQSDVNRKKIAVTTSDGITQCYVEVEKWNDVNQQAWLWVKVPNISNTSDTILYLYYDVGHVDNTDYVGDPNSTPAENVWDSNFKLVTHMGDDPDTYHIRDSTLNDNDGTKEWPNAPIQADGKIGNAQDFNVIISDHVNCGTSSSLDIRYTLTIEAWIKPDSLSAVHQNSIVDRGSSYWFFVFTDGTLAFLRFKGSFGAFGTTATIPTGTFTHVAVTYDNSSLDEVKLYINGELSREGSLDGPIDSSASTVTLGDRANAHPFDGIIDEVRISGEVINAAWIKANYESERDDLLDFGSEESLPYELDLEVQWTNVDYSEANEELCLYGGTMGSENIRVDVWSGGAWQNLFTDLNTGWNNATVSSYLTSSTFTIRFKGSIETGDAIQDSWNIDAALLHVWS